MAKFTVLRRVDAWIDYAVEIEADDARAAATAAYHDADALAWRRVGQEEFWNAQFTTLDARGDEIAETVLVRG